MLFLRKSVKKLTGEVQSIIILSLIFAHNFNNNVNTKYYFEKNPFFIVSELQEKTFIKEWNYAKLGIYICTKMQ